jgi:GAF domain-containing protein
MAIRAGQEARSVFAAENSMKSETAIGDSLDQIRNTASESILLMQCAQDVEKALSVKDVAEAVSQYLRRTTPATVYAIYRYDSQADNLVCTATSGDFQGLLNGLVIPVGQRVSGWTAVNERTAVNSDATLDLAKIATFFSPPLRSMVSTPVIQGRLLAVLAGYSGQESAFTEAHRLAFEQGASTIANKLAQSSASSNLVSFPLHNH